MEMVEKTSSNCIDLDICTPCVCSFRNQIVGYVEEQYNNMIRTSDHDNDTILTYFETILSPWMRQTRCIYNLTLPYTDGDSICDISQMSGVLQDVNQTIVLTCPFLFLCGKVEFDAQSLSISSLNAFIADNSFFANRVPPKATGGSAGVLPGDNGMPGHHGKHAPDISLEIHSLIPSSARKIRYVSRGGDGGDGGDGALGLSRLSSIPFLENALQVVNQGVVTGRKPGVCKEVFCARVVSCPYCERIWVYQARFEFDACGGDGGYGGDGGHGGSAGNLYISSHTNLLPELVQEESAGGLPGMAGAGAPGLVVDRLYTGTE